MSDTDNGGVVEAMFKELYRLIWAMVWDHANSDRWLLEPDEMFAELSAELVKVVARYPGKPHDELKRLLIVSLRNRCADLLIMAYGTHRAAESDMVSMDDEDEWLLHSSPEVRGTHDSYFTLDSFIGNYNLSQDAVALTSEALHPGGRARRVIELVVARKQATSPMNGWRLEMNAYILRRALGWDMARFQAAWDEVQMAVNCL